MSNSNKPPFDKGRGKDRKKWELVSLKTKTVINEGVLIKVCFFLERTKRGKSKLTEYNFTMPHYTNIPVMGYYKMCWDLLQNRGIVDIDFSKAYKVKPTSSCIFQTHKN